MLFQLTYRQCFCAVLVLALVVRLGAAMWWEQRLARQNQAFDFPDSESYCYLAKRLANGQSFEFGPEGKIFRTPGYPLLIAPGYWFEKSDPPRWWLRGLSIVLGVSAVALVMGLARQLFGERAALIAGTLVAVDIGAISLSVFALSEAPFCPLMLAHLWLWSAAWQSEKRSVALALAAGLIAAAATLMRPSFLLFIPFAAVLGCLWFRPLPRHAKLAGVMMVGLALGMSPWWIRNAMVAGEFVPTTLQVGASLYDGIRPDAKGDSDMRFVPVFTEKQRELDAQSTAPLVGAFESRLDRTMKDAAVAWAKENPAKVAQLVGVKFVRIWSPWPNAAELGGGMMRWLTAATYVPILALGVWGLIRFRNEPLAWLCVVPAIYFTALHVVFVSSLRYRQPAMLAVAILAAAVIASWFDFAPGKREATSR
jgi:4-amino-4-deoxy-L-arabinose transferase-like glycosyltransferase